MQKIMTAEQAFNVSMNEYPSLYTSDTLDGAKMKFYDYIFNVIGNGFRDMEEFKEKHTINKFNKHLIDSFPDKYIGNTPLYMAYKEVRDYGRSFKSPVFESALLGIYTKEDLKQMPEVKYSLLVNNTNKEEKECALNFYPNFQKMYSMVWDDISCLDKSWFEAAHFFYTKAKEYFASGNTDNYRATCPKDDNSEKWIELIANYEENFSKYVKEGKIKPEYFAEITKEYGTPYNGDTKEFIKAIWAKEHARINSFIDETLERLDSYLKQENAYPKKTGMKK